MKITLRALFTSIFFIILFYGNCQTNSDASFEKGVSESLAKSRKEKLQDLTYQLSLIIPEQKSGPIKSSEVLSFNLANYREPLLIDFKEKADHLEDLIVNGKKHQLQFTNEHIFIQPEYLKQGQNSIQINFIAGDLSLNRNEDYLYTLLVPDRARTVFPCFDQPDLKAKFLLSLTIPKNWTAVSNGPLHDSVLQAQTKTFHFDSSDKISTYLFSFVAGKFELVHRSMKGRQMSFYHRETDTSKINNSLDPVFRIQSEAIEFMQKYTGISYPFKKFDFIGIPDFQYGGMEHPGAIQYKAQSLFLDAGATRDELINRSNLLSHETAHMWFGDLVTMNWFNDVWMKEVFANFMADKITKVALANTNYDLKFLLDHFPAAYSTDRTAGANPIRQELNNLQDAGSLYGNIIYHKAPIMMRQLERLMGAEPFRKGLSVYLKKYAYQNASWPDLIRILDDFTSADLVSWNQVWVNESGRPVFDYQIKTSHNKIDELIITQKGEDGSIRLWPQLFEIALVYPDKVEQVTVNMQHATENIATVKGKNIPLFFLFNSSGQGYGLFPSDSLVVVNAEKLNDPVMRASAYINQYENMLAGRYIRPLTLLHQYRKIFRSEKEELNLRQITGQMSDIYWRLINPVQRTSLAPGLEKELWNAINTEKAPGKKKILFKTYQSIALTKKAQDTLYSIWKLQKAPLGILLNEDDYTSLALALALRDYPEKNILTEQLGRIQNKDRRERLVFLMPSLASDVHTRDAFFTSLMDEKNREKEAWVVMALQYLHHPLRAATSEKYLKQNLDILQEIQLTGDIFFPQSWLQSTFGMCQSRYAVEVIDEFLSKHKEYNSKLKDKILQVEDGVIRAQQLIKNDTVIDNEFNILN